MRATLFPALLVAAAAASAQQAPVERVEVTGTNIKRIDTETPAPLQVIRREDIERSGLQTVPDVIRSLTADNAGSVPLAFVRGFGAGGSAVSLRGLNAGSTLVLLNGRRLAPYGLADDGVYNFVNLGTIPLDAVERIEVLKDGASAIYGSDAIAGVVNVILRSDYRGASVAGSWGTTRYGDGDRSRASLVLGGGDLARDGSNIFVSFEAMRQDAIRQADRSSRGWIGNPDLRGYGYAIDSGTTLQHLRGFITPQAANPNPFGAVRDPRTGRFLQLPGCSSSYVLPQGLGGCLWAESDFAQVIPSQRFASFMSRAITQIKPGAQAYLEVGVTSDSVETVGAPVSVSAIWPDALGFAVRNNSTIALGANHPDNPFGAPARLRYVTGDIPRGADFDTIATRVVAGVKATAGAWDLDSALTYSGNSTRVHRYGNVRDSVLRSLLDGSNPLGFYRLGANAYLNSPELYAALAPPVEYTSKASLASWDLKGSRELLQLPGGPLALAAGVEARWEKTDHPPLPYTAEADLIGFGYVQYHQQRRVVSGFGELAIPVARTFEASLAARTDRYSDYGSSTTPKAGFRWQPARAFLLRGTASAGFRAPGPGESGDSVSSGATSFHDPVRCAYPGVSGCEGLMVGVTSGSRDAKPQKSRGNTLGFVLEPVRWASVSVDSWSIRRTNDPSASDLAALLAHPELFPGVTIVRDTNNLPGVPDSGTLLGVVGPFESQGETRARGIDLDARLRSASGPLGRFSAEFFWTTLTHLKGALLDGSLVDFAGTHGPTGLSSNSGTPRHRGSLTLGWDLGPWTLSTTTTYVSGVAAIEYQGSPDGCLTRFANGDPAPDGCRVGSFTTTALFARYRPAASVEIFGSVRNLFDRIAPLDPVTYGAFRYNAAFHLEGAIGRQYNVGVRYKF